MLPPIKTTLQAAASVTAIIGNPPRVYRHGDAPEDTSKPYVTWQVIYGNPENTLSELPASDRVSLQVNCWHTTDIGIVDLATAVRDAMEPFAHCTGMPVDQREPETKLYWIALQFDWHLSR